MDNTLKNSIHGLILLSALLTCTLFSSCDNEPIDTEDEGHMVVDVDFEILTVDGREVNKDGRTKVFTETGIENITALVFTADNKFDYMASGTIKSSDDNGTMFTVKLRSSKTPVYIYFVANSTSAFTVPVNIPQWGDALSTVKRKIALTYGVNGISKELPMAGWVQLPALNANLVNTIHIKMLRAVARADIVVAPEISTSTFQLVNARIYRANDSIQVIPVPEVNWENPVISTTSILEKSTYRINSLNAINVSSTNKIEGRIFLPESRRIINEAERTSKATALVVGGRFNNSLLITYYRIDFDSNQSEHPFGQILRNYCYLFTISNVSGDGWSSPNDAANNVPSNIIVSVQPWIDVDLEIDLDN
jgi:hypothetical protein